MEATACTRLSPRPLPAASRSRSEPIEALHDLLALIGRHAAARIAHDELPPSAFHGHGDDDASVGRRVLHGVVEHVGERLEQEITITVHGDGSLGQHERDAALLSQRAIQIAGVAHYFIETQLHERRDDAA